MPGRSHGVAASTARTPKGRCRRKRGEQRPAWATDGSQMVNDAKYACFFNVPPGGSTGALREKRGRIYSWPPDILPSEARLGELRFVEWPWLTTRPCVCCASQDRADGGRAARSRSVLAWRDVASPGRYPWGHHPEHSSASRQDRVSASLKATIIAYNKGMGLYARRILC